MKHLLLITIAAVVLVGCGESQATDVGKFFFSGYSSDADMFGFYTTMGMIIIMSALASLTPIVMYNFTIRKWDVAAQNKFGVIYYTITLVIPVLLVVGFEFGVFVDFLGGLYLFIVLIMIPFTILGIGIIAAPIVSVLVVLACHRRQDRCSIHKAAKTGNIEVVELLISKGADVNAKGDGGLTPLHHAASRRDKEIAELLIAKGADVNANDRGGSTPLHYAKTKEVVELLIANGADVNAKDNNDETPLTYAINSGNTETEVLLRKLGGMTSEELTSGMTPLHAAARKGLKEVVELLIANGADVNVKNRVGETPLDVAINKNRTETADLLREHGGKTGAELNVLLDAAKKGGIEAVKQHLAAGADVNAKTADGTTPLHNAAVYGHTEVAELLIANGANMNAIIVSGRNQGKTPLDVAILLNQPETAELLRKHGGKTGEELKAEGK